MRRLKIAIVFLAYAVFILFILAGIYMLIFLFIVSTPIIFVVGLRCAYQSMKENNQVVFVVKESTFGREFESQINNNQ